MEVKPTEKYIKRLTQEWLQYGRIILGCDFDDTISPWKFNSEEDLLQITKIVKLLTEAKRTGAYIVIFTSCNEDRHDEIKLYCQSLGLEIDSINKNPIELPYGNSGKIYANIFLDDRAGLLESLDVLETAMYRVRGERRSLTQHFDAA